MFLNDFLDDRYESPTLMRTRGELLIRTPSGSNLYGAAGLIEYEHSSASLVNNAPRPIGDGDAEWIWWTPIIGLLGNGNTGSDIGWYPIDSKARRKLSSASSLVFVIESGGGPTFDYALSLRCLFQE
jgi:hypothetical protein